MTRTARSDTPVAGATSVTLPQRPCGSTPPRWSTNRPARAHLRASARAASFSPQPRPAASTRNFSPPRGAPRRLKTAAVSLATRRELVFEPPAWARHAAVASDCRIVSTSSTPHRTPSRRLRVIPEGVVSPLRMPGARLIDAVSPVGVGVGGWELTPPMANRFLHLRVGADSGESVDDRDRLGRHPQNGAGRRAHPQRKARVAGQVTSFIAAHPSCSTRCQRTRHRPGASHGQRSWENVVKILPGRPAKARPRRARAARARLAGAAAAPRPLRCAS